MYSAIIVPLDGSESVERALTPAAALARREGAALQLLTVVKDASDVEHSRTYVEGKAAALGAPAVALPPVEAPSPAEGIRQTVAGKSDALVCMATHGDGIGRALLGSTAEGVIRAVAGPVLLVGPNFRPETAEAPDTIIVCVDGSALSETILEAAAAWTKAYGLRLVLVQVVDPNTARRATRMDTSEDAYLRGLAHDLRGSGVEAQWDVLHRTDAAAAIAGYAAGVPTAIVALSTHGATGLARLAMGSVSMKVAHDSPRATLVMRPARLSEGDVQASRPGAPASR